MAVSLRCQVLEVPAQSDWTSREPYRDLLPWADPYIALLMQRLEERYDMGPDDADSDDSAADEEEDALPIADYDWRDDALSAAGPEQSRQGWYPPVYGGWPLLDDLEQGEAGGP